MSFGGSKGPSKKEKADAEAVRADQRVQIAQLDSEENNRIKKLITGARGTRSYRGGPMFRARPSNTAGAPRNAAGGASAAPAAGALREGGARGGLNRPGMRSLILS